MVIDETMLLAAMVVVVVVVVMVVAVVSLIELNFQFLVQFHLIVLI